MADEERYNYASLKTITEIIEPWYEDAIMDAMKPVRWWYPEEVYLAQLAEWEYNRDQMRLDRKHGERLGPGPKEYWPIRRQREWEERMRRLVKGHHPGRVIRP